MYRVDIKRKTYIEKHTDGNVILEHYHTLCRIHGPVDKEQILLSFEKDSNNVINTLRSYLVVL